MDKRPLCFRRPEIRNSTDWCNRKHKHLGCHTFARQSFIQNEFV